MIKHLTSVMIWIPRASFSNSWDDFGFSSEERTYLESSNAGAASVSCEEETVLLSMYMQTFLGMQTWGFLPRVFLESNFIMLLGVLFQPRVIDPHVLVKYLALEFFQASFELILLLSWPLPSFLLYGKVEEDVCSFKYTKSPWRLVSSE